MDVTLVISCSQVSDSVVCPLRSIAEDMELSSHHGGISTWRCVGSGKLHLKEVGKLIDPGKPLLSKLSVFYGIIPTQILLPEVLDENFGSSCKWYYKSQWIILACERLVQVSQCRLKRLL